MRFCDGRRSVDGQFKGVLAGCQETFVEQSVDAIVGWDRLAVVPRRPPQGGDQSQFAVDGVLIAHQQTTPFVDRFVDLRCGAFGQVSSPHCEVSIPATGDKKTAQLRS
jgi:hypothetical protein